MAAHEHNRHGCYPNEKKGFSHHDDADSNHKTMFVLGHFGVGPEPQKASVSTEVDRVVRTEGERTPDVIEHLAVVIPLAEGESPAEESPMPRTRKQSSEAVYLSRLPMARCSASASAGTPAKPSARSRPRRPISSVGQPKASRRTHLSGSRSPTRLVLSDLGRRCFATAASGTRRTQPGTNPASGGH